MSSNYSIVTERQLRRLTILDLFSGTILILPIAAGRLCGILGVLGILLGGIAAYVFACFILSCGGFDRLYGSGIGARIVCVVYGLRYYVTAACLLGVFAGIVNVTFLSDISKGVLGAGLLLVGLYLAWKGQDARLRLGEMLVWVVVVPLILTMLLALPNMQAQHFLIRPFGSENAVSGCISTAFLSFSLFLPSEWLLFCRTEQIRHAKKQLLAAFLIAVLLNIVFLIVCIGVFSVPAMNSEQWPTVTLMQLGRIPGNFLARQDGIVLTFWIAGMFMLIAGYFYYGNQCIKRLNRRAGNPIAAAVVIFLIFLVIPLKRAPALWLYEMLLVNMPLAVVLPLIFKGWRCLGEKSGKKSVKESGNNTGRKSAGNMKKKAGKMIVILLTANISAGLSGCSLPVEIEERNFVMCLGIDSSDEGLTVSMGFPDLMALTGEGENIHYPPEIFGGESLGQIENTYSEQANKRIDYGQLQMIVFGRTMMENTEKMNEVLSYMKEHQEFSRNILVCMSDGSAKDIIALDDQVNGSVGIYMRQMFENNSSSCRRSLNDLICGLSLPEKRWEMPVVIENNDKPKLSHFEMMIGCTVK